MVTSNSSFLFYLSYKRFDLTHLSLCRSFTEGKREIDRKGQMLRHLLRYENFIKIIIAGGIKRERLKLVVSHQEVKRRLHQQGQALRFKNDDGSYLINQVIVIAISGIYKTKWSEHETERNGCEQHISFIMCVRPAYFGL